MKPQQMSDSVFSEVRLLWPITAELGEGPIWIASEQALYFVDIKGGQLHRYQPSSEQRQSFTLPGLPSFVVPAEDDSLIVGMGMALHRFCEDRLQEVLALIEGDPQCRTNDASVDPQGRLWFGTMDLGQQRPVGKVYRYDGDSVHPAGRGCAITNGPAISPDGNTLYHVDTLARTIWAFDISERDTLCDGKVFANIDAEHGYPDGVTVDAEGAVWVALWGGSCVRRYSPEGELLASIALPCTQVTKIAFGGKDLRTVFVTSARTGLSAEALQEQPLAGGLFAFESSVAGLPTHAVKLSR